MASQNPGEPPINAPVTDDKGNMTVPWHLWCVMMWKKIGAGGALSLAWGSITGLISAQADLVAAFAAKVTGNVAITGATHTKITYDSKGLVTAGSDLVAGDIPNIAESQVTGLATDLAGKQAALGFTPENVANKTTDGTLAANSDTLYPSEKAVKTYVDGHSSAVPTGTGFRHVTSGAEDGAAAKVAIDTTADTSMSDVTTNDVSTTKHGFAPKAPNDATKFLDGTGAYSVPAGTGTGTVTHTAGALTAHAVVVGNGSDDEKVLAALGSSGQVLKSQGAGSDPIFADIVESMIVLADNTTDDVSVTKHGFAPKAPNDSTKFLNGVGAYAVPPGSFASPLTTKGDIYTRGASADARLGVGTDGYVLQADTGATNGISWQPKTVLTSGLPAWLSTHPDAPPNSPNAMDDEFDAGSLDVKWTNISGATPNFLNGTLGDASAGTDLLISQPRPTAPYEFRAKFVHTMPVAGFVAFGIFLRDSAGGKVVELRFESANNFQTQNVELTYWTNFSTFSSNNVQAAVVRQAAIYLRLKDDATNLSAWYSYDGIHWIRIVSQSRTAFLPSSFDQIGVWVPPNGTDTDIVGAGSCAWFRRTL